VATPNSSGDFSIATAVEGEDVPQRITDHAGVCLSCAAFFKIVEDASRKRLRACPGSVTSGGMQRHADDDGKPKKGDCTPEKVEDDHATTH